MPRRSRSYNVEVAACCSNRSADTAASVEYRACSAVAPQGIDVDGALLDQQALAPQDLRREVGDANRVGEQRGQPRPGAEGRQRQEVRPLAVEDDVGRNQHQPLTVARPPGRQRLQHLGHAPQSRPWIVAAQHLRQAAFVEDLVGDAEVQVPVEPEVARIGDGRDQRVSRTAGAAGDRRPLRERGDVVNRDQPVVVVAFLRLVDVSPQARSHQLRW